MQPHEEKILIDIFKDEELDIFGIFKRREKIKKKQKSKNRNVYFYDTMVKRLIDIYGREGAMPYLKALFKEEVAQ